MDNLASHRNKVNETLNHNLFLVNQSQNVYNKFAGLVIVDYLILGIYKDRANTAK